MKHPVNPPNSPETEMAIIGCVLVNKAALNYCIINIEADYFYDPMHKLIWKVITALYSENKPIDEVIIKNWIDTNQLDKGNIFHVDYLIRLSSSFRVAYNIKEYCEILIETYQKRQIQSYFRDKYPEITKEGKWEDNLNEIQNKFYDLTNEFLIKDSSKVEINNSAKTFIDNVAERGILAGLQTEYNGIDRLTGGFQKSNIIVIAGVTGMGKTSFALNLCANMLNKGKSVMFVSMEMSSDLLIQRLYSSESNVSSYKIKQHSLTIPKLDTTDWANLYETVDKFKQWNMTIFDKGNYTVQNIRGLAKQKQQNKTGLDIIFIDYLQLITNGQINYKKNRNDEIATITRELKLLAMELKIPIVLLANLIGKHPKEAALF